MGSHESTILVEEWEDDLKYGGIELQKELLENKFSK